MTISPFYSTRVSSSTASTSSLSSSVNKYARTRQVQLTPANGSRAHAPARYVSFCRRGVRRRAAGLCVIDWRTVDVAGGGVAPRRRWPCSARHRRRSTRRCRLSTCHVVEAVQTTTRFYSVLKLSVLNFALSLISSQCFTPDRTSVDELSVKARA